MRCVRRAGAGRAAAVAAVLLATALGAVHPAAADDGPAAGALSARAERLMHEASRAVDAHEKARGAVQRGERRLARIERHQATEQDRLDRLRAALGAQARSEYRGGAGLGPMVRVVTAPSPQQALDTAVLARRGDRAVGQLATRVRDSRDRVAADRAASERLVDDLRAQADRRAAARKEIETKLDRVQEELRQERERAAALLASRATTAAGAMPSSRGGCARGAVDGEGDADADGRTWVAPVHPAPLSAGFGQGGNRWAHQHTGQDFAVGTGTPVHAVGAGTVQSTGCGDGFGNQVIVRHADGYFTQYAHLSLIGVGAGDRLKAGQVLGLSGATGNVSGPHLHFEVRLTPQFGSGIDPLPWLRARGIRV
ncbi:peptidoglycan DD-metalloendopeptidase family protein [Streptomyces sp. NPDC051684]|uniref:peptidoglycan DD-metalloendopeptidase family protein n=1 Tax=Streptomyces sp. NPDC051684 TaxID=3365670 RepID=UPI00378E8316